MTGTAPIDLVDLSTLPRRRTPPRADVVAAANAALDLAERDPAAGSAEVDRLRFQVVGRRVGRGIAVRRSAGYTDADLEVLQAAAGYAHDATHRTQFPNLEPSRRPDFAACYVDPAALYTAICEAVRAAR